MAGLINTGIWGFISSAKATGKKKRHAKVLPGAGADEPLSLEIGIPQHLCRIVVDEVTEEPAGEEIKL